MDSLSDKSNRNEIPRVAEKLPDRFESAYHDTLDRKKSTIYGAQAYDLSCPIPDLVCVPANVTCRATVCSGCDITSIDEDDLDDDEFLLSICAGLVLSAEDPTKLA